MTFLLPPFSLLAVMVMVVVVMVVVVVAFSMLLFTRFPFSSHPHYSFFRQSNLSKDFIHHSYLPSNFYFSKFWEKGLLGPHLYFSVHRTVFFSFFFVFWKEKKKEKKRKENKYVMLRTSVIAQYIFT